MSLDKQNGNLSCSQPTDSTQDQNNISKQSNEQNSDATRQSKQLSLNKNDSKNNNFSPQKTTGHSTQNSQEDECVDANSQAFGFEKKICDLELFIKQTPDVDLEKVKELIELYTMAVEYYDSSNESKFMYYKNKILSLHQQENVVKAMNRNIPRRQDSGKSNSTHTQSTNGPSHTNLYDEAELAALEKKQIERQEKMKVIEEKAVVAVTDAEVNKILDIQDENVIDIEITIEKDLKKQTNNILKRLNKRKKTKGQCQTPPSSSSRNFKLNSGKNEPSSFGTQVEENEKKQISKSTAVGKQPNFKPRMSVIESIVSNFVTDKKRSLNQEMTFKVDQIEFEYEKLIFQLEKNKTVLTQEEKRKLEQERDYKIKMVEEEYEAKEKQEIEIIHQKYYKTDPNSILSPSKQRESYIYSSLVVKSAIYDHPTQESIDKDFQKTATIYQ